ncbi:MULTISPECIES: Tox-REase-5 domain-containing protein [unclassified Acinetobacter]|uniref:Tox-REase-5 domain-containing protein n=2 Tax=unclassified Acinetobacter TaxID=196816 RepID=UPI000DD02DBD|nr:MULTISPECIES: Tox-REase-5 domain-containing protein [unclassified Acinetobacter]
MVGFLISLGRLATVGGRGAATGTTGGATAGSTTIAVEAAKGMAAVVLAKEVSKDITKQQRCNKCEPYQLGNKHQIKRPMGNEINTEYQIKIANLSSYPLTFQASDPYLVSGNTKQTTEIQEWVLSGVSFDGLWPMQCILVEAKGRYAQFLEGKPDFMKNNIFLKMRNEATSQRSVVSRFKTSKLNWYFYEEETKVYFDRFSRNIVPTIFMPL